MEQIKIFGEKFKALLIEDIKIVALDESLNVEPAETKHEWQATSSNGLACSHCKVEFTDAASQRGHYKLDWHRYNIKQNLLGKTLLTEEQFNERTDDLSSISGSESEKDDASDKIILGQSGKIFIRTLEDKLFSMYRCVCANERDDCKDGLFKTLMNVHLNNQWTILMLGGGHFAGAVFQGDNPILHKTFHCYTVRAGQGGSQSSRDSKNASSAPKSAGASLRRYNELALIKHVTAIVETWKNEITASSLIIYRAAGAYNKSVLFGGKNPLINKNDERLRTVPFSTRRATFSEVKRVHSILTTVHLYDSLDVATKQLEPVKAKKKLINRAKSRETRAKDLPAKITSSEESEEESDCAAFCTKESEIVFQDCLQPFEDSTIGRNKQKHTKKKVRKSKKDKIKEEEDMRKKELYDVVKNGNLDKLKNIFKCNYLVASMEDNVVNADKYINEIIDAEGNTILHVAALHEQKDILTFLLENDANLCTKNIKHQTPYTCTQSKSIREIFKAFALKNLDKFNYNKAQIPVLTSTLTSEELAEKKLMQKRAKRNKEKERKKERETANRENEERLRFVNLSDREKRALAAERRMAGQSGLPMSLTRCFLCGSDMTGKVPFEYLTNRFCTIECLQAHRKKTPTILS